MRNIELEKMAAFDAEVEKANEKIKRKPRSRERGPGKKNSHRVSFCVSCQPEERDAIKKLAEEKGISISDLVLSLIR